MVAFFLSSAQAWGFEYLLMFCSLPQSMATQLVELESRRFYKQYTALLEPELGMCGTEALARSVKLQADGRGRIPGSAPFRRALYPEGKTLGLYIEMM